MRKGVLTNNRLIELHRKARHPANHMARAVKVYWINSGLIWQCVIPDIQRHYDFFQRRIACPLPQTINGALNLPRAISDSGE